MTRQAINKTKRKMHIRKTVSGTDQRPRLTVYRSSKHIYAQLVDDVAGKTLVAASDLKATKVKPVDSATKVGAEIAAQAQKSGIKKVVFDRNGYKFHGRIKALAEGARSAGLEF